MKTALTWIASLCFVLILSVSAYAVNPDEVLDDPQLEERARVLSKDLRCLVCQNQSIDDSDAPLARDLRILVRERLVAGDSNAEVIDFVVARYGEFVLLRPRIGAHTVLLWASPALVLAFGMLYLWRRRYVAKPVDQTSVHLSESEEKRLQDLISRD